METKKTGDILSPNPTIWGHSIKKPETISNKKIKNVAFFFPPGDVTSTSLPHVWGDGAS